MKRKTIQYIKISGFIILSLYCIICVYHVITHEKQGDFHIYICGVKAYSNGDSPYNTDDLSYYAGKNMLLPYYYPPYSLYFFKPFLLFEYRQSYYIFLGLKLVVIFFFILIWWKFFLLNKSYAIILFILCVFAYRETIIRDLYAGNVSCFEQLFIWLAVVFFIKRKPILFCFFIICSSFFKLTSLVFLLFLLIDKDKKSILLMVGTSLLFLFINFISYINNPTIYENFLRNLINMHSEWGSVNPASLPFIRGAVNIFLNISGLNIDYLDFVIYIIYCVFLIMITYTMVKGFNFRKNRIEFIIICFFLYAVILPRFKDNSFILLIIPSLYVIRDVISSTLAKSLALGFICIHFYEYQSLLVALILFTIYLKYIHKQVKGQLSVANNINEL